MPICATGFCYDTKMMIHKDEGGNVDIPCKYPVELTNHPKHLCKEKKGCKPLGTKPNTTQKYSLSDTENGSNFTVTIHNLDKEDNGSYWCGVQASDDYVIVLSNVVLNITGE